MARVPEIIRRNPVSQVAPRAPEAGQGWAALAAVSKMAADVVRPAAEQAATIAGQKSVYKDPQTGELKVEERSMYGGDMAVLHNQAAYAKYLGQKEIEIGQTMSELSVKHQFDPAGFDAATSSYIKLLKADENVPEALKESVIQSVEVEAQRRFNGLQRAAVTRTYQEADTESSTARDLAVEDYVSLYVEGAFDEAEEKWKEIEEKSRYRADTPYITETPSETEAYLRGARGAAKAARLIRDLSDLEGADNISDEKRSEIETVLKDPDLSPKVRQQLYTATQGRLKSIDAAGIVKGLTDDSYEAMIIRRESGGNDQAKADTSSAFGPHQFLKGTWARLVKKYKPEWAEGLNEKQIMALRGDREKSSEMFQHFRRENATQLAAAGLPVNPATEHMAHFFGAGGAVNVLSADPNAPLSSVVDKATMDANPFLKGMTARDAQVWAARKMTMKASDIAAQSVQVNEIDDPEVRALAITALQERLRVRRDIENAAASVFEERLVQGDASLTEQEILENHDLSTDDQGRLVRGLATARKEVEKLQSTVTKIAAGETFNPTDTKDRNAVNDVYTQMVGDQTAMSSDQALQAARDLTRQTGIIPKTVVGEVKGAIASENPEDVARGMETLGMLEGEADTGLNAVVGGKGLQDQLSDYSFYGQFMSPEEAAQRLIDNREKKPKNVTDEAKAQAKELDIGDIQERFDDAWFSDPNIGDEDAGANSIDLLPSMQQEEMMSEYSRLFQDAYKDTGDVDLSKNRALDQMGRIYGVNMVSGNKRVMKFPPNKMYPAVSGSHDWMTEQVGQEVNDFLALQRGENLLPGEQIKPPSSLVERFAHGASMGASSGWVYPEQIKLVSDATTANEAKSGRPPSYIVYAMRDGVLEQLPQRFRFDPSEARKAAREDFETGHKRAIGLSTDYYRMVEKYGKDTADQMRRDQMGITAR